MARHDQALARLGRESVRNELIAAVTNTFHDIISADELQSAETAAVETVKAQLEEARARMKAGAVLKDEVLSLEVRLARAEDRSLAAKNAGKLARAALASLLAVDTSSVEKIQCEDVPPPGVPLTLDRGQMLARENSPGYQAAKRRKAKARLGVTKASAPLYPALGLYGRYYLDDEYAKFDADRANWIVGADLTWSIFSGFSTTAQKAAAEAEARRTDARLRRAELELERRVKSAYIRLSDAQSRRKVAEAAVARADETLDLVAKRYGAGAVTITRYLEAEQDRTFTRVNAIRARCNERRALAEVARVIGWWTSERKDQP
jgi:outer membrane protein TolC